MSHVAERRAARCLERMRIVADDAATHRLAVRPFDEGGEGGGDRVPHLARAQAHGLGRHHLVARRDDRDARAGVHLDACDAGGRERGELPRPDGCPAGTSTAPAAKSSSSPTTCRPTRTARDTRTVPSSPISASSTITIASAPSGTAPPVEIATAVPGESDGAGGSPLALAADQLERDRRCSPSRAAVSPASTA